MKNLCPGIVLAILLSSVPTVLRGVEPPVHSKPSVCPAVEGLGPLLVSGNVLLLGEMHGTEQSPRFTAAVACQGLRKGLPVTVGLEIPRGQEPAGVAYLASEGTSKDREALLATDHWTRSYQDGRSSGAMLELIEELRRFSRAGLPVRIRWFDIDDAPHPERDRRMAERLAEAVSERPADLFVVLTGNYHARQVKGAPWNKEFYPMGLHLAQIAPKARVISLDSSYTDGEAWACLVTDAAPNGECKGWPMKGQGKSEGPFPRIVPGSGLDEKGYHGVYEIGPLSASLPAVPAKTTKP